MENKIMIRAAELLKENKGKHSVENAIITIVIEFSISYTEASDIVVNAIKKITE